MPCGDDGANDGGVAERGDAEALKASVRKDVQVRVLPPLPTASAGPSFSTSQLQPYSYLLGVYLGDGCISRAPRTFRLEIYMNAKDTRVIRQTADAMRELLPRNRVGFRCRPSVVVVKLVFESVATTVSTAWAGPQALAADRPRVVAARDRGAASGRFRAGLPRLRRVSPPANRSWSQLSRVLVPQPLRGHRDAVATACDLAGLRWRRSNRETITIARRHDVARLDELMAGGETQTPSVVPSSLRKTSTPGA